MKIAVISDIHGNMEAIDSVMKDIKENGCEKVFVLGDYAMAGSEPDKAVEFFMNKAEDSNYYLIQGNTDFMIANYSNDLYNSLKAKAPVMSEALRKDVELLDEKSKMFLRDLPVQKVVEFEGIKFLLVHGSPRRNNEDILPTTPIEEVEEMVKDVDADVILCGHTHIPCGFQTKNKKTVVNAGSIGRPFTSEPKSCYLIITVENGKCEFMHKFVDYNKELTSQKLLSRGFDGAEKLAKTILNPQERHF